MTTTVLARCARPSTARSRPRPHCCSAWCCLSDLGAQDPTGTIEGVVTDPTAAAVTKARVVAVNLATGLTKESETATDGFYRILLVPVGNYSVTVHARRIRHASPRRHRRQRQPERPSERAARAVVRQRDGQGCRWRAAGRHHQQRARTRRHRPRAGGPAAQRTQLHAARTAADRRRAVDGRSRDRRRQPAPGAGLRGERDASRAEHVSRRRSAEP